MKSKKNPPLAGLSDYFFSSTWILNLGVVPLLRFSVLRFLPILVALRCRFSSVTRVLETIIFLLKTTVGRQIASLRRANLTLLRQAVKIFTLIMLGASPLYAADSILLALGEHREIKVLDLEHYANGNREVLSLHHDQAAQTLLLRGETQGYSELIVRSLHTGEKRYHVYVLSKKQHLEIYQLADAFQGMGLRVLPEGLRLKVQGTIKTKEDYLRLHRLNAKHHTGLSLQVKLGEQLQKNLLAELYRNFYQHYADSIECSVEGIHLRCQFSTDHQIPEEVTTHYRESWFVSFSRVPGQSARSNYRVKMKLIQVERLDGQEISFGLDGLNLSWGEIYRKSVASIIQEKQTYLQARNIKLSTLADPETLLRLGTQAEIKIGAEIPYSQAQGNLGQTHTKWKFAGLKVEVKLERNANQYQISYKTGFTRPDGDAVAGNQESATLFVPLDTPLPLFQVHFQTIGEQERGIPYLKDIPILGHLFKSSTKERNYKTLTGVIQIERESF